eukprot:8468314-Lingulodinium_polyedra.AAC.1
MLRATVQQSSSSRSWKPAPRKSPLARAKPRCAAAGVTPQMFRLSQYTIATTLFLVSRGAGEPSRSSSSS